MISYPITSPSIPWGWVHWLRFLFRLISCASNNCCWRTKRCQILVLSASLWIQGQPGSQRMFPCPCAPTWSTLMRESVLRTFKWKLNWVQNFQVCTWLNVTRVCFWFTIEEREKENVKHFPPNKKILSWSCWSAWDLKFIQVLSRVCISDSQL